MSSRVSQAPSLDFELSQSVRFIIGMDEVGRGCIAGDLAVGAVIIDLENYSNWPEKLRDSKLLTEKTREEIFSEVTNWVRSNAVGLASVAEIETQGIITALGLAGSRALNQLLADSETAALLSKHPTVVLLDGNQDYLGFKSFGFKVVTKVKADQDCVSVAAASVIAKVTRDRLMLDLAKSYPEYGLESNKGYASVKHRKALLEHGPSPIHRLSWLSKILKG